MNQRLFTAFRKMNSTPNHDPITRRMYTSKAYQLNERRDELTHYVNAQAVFSAANQFPELIQKERHDSYLGQM